MAAYLTDSLSGSTAAGETEGAMGERNEKRVSEKGGHGDEKAGREGMNN